MLSKEYADQLIDERFSVIGKLVNFNVVYVRGYHSLKQYSKLPVLKIIGYFFDSINNKPSIQAIIFKGYKKEITYRNEELYYIDNVPLTEYTTSQLKLMAAGLKVKRKLNE